ncbi:hypothetical protein EXN66_Car008516 [Channa argus]|uniref:Uncharacterized protein n=1 Tax=Channa argus TaxID=215402 RepID=A0A6G1PRB1_CHAAH|nr:hypothetical protein EXN66_Car008516 [Channa argus]
MLVQSTVLLCSLLRCTLLESVNCNHCPQSPSLLHVDFFFLVVVPGNVLT